MMDFTRRQFRNHQTTPRRFPKCVSLSHAHCPHRLHKNAGMDSDSDDDLIASLVGSGMKGGAKAVGDDFLRFQRGERGESSRGEEMRVENPASSPPASPPVRTSRNFSALRAAAPAAGTSAPRAKLLWKKVRDNRLADNGERPVEGAAAEQSRFWRLQNGASAFLFGVDKDVDGRRKNRAEKVMKRVNQLSKRSKFARSSEFDEELKQLQPLTSFQTHRLCRDKGLEIRNKDGHPVPLAKLKERLLHLEHGRSSADWFHASPFGRNKRGYWAPIALGLTQCLIISLFTVGATYAIYMAGAHYHDKHRCDWIMNWLNPQCQVADFVRTTAKQWVYRWYWQVGTVIAARAGHWADKMSKEASRLALDATDNISKRLGSDGDGNETIPEEEFE